jgi:NADH-quinone oxidoreductase subunit E
MTEEEQVLRIDEIIGSYPAEQSIALAALQDMQHAFNYIPDVGLTRLAEYLGCPKAQLYSMATFYKALSLNPKGEHIIKICNGTACHIRGSMNLVKGLKRELGIDPGETTEDGRFSVELVNCLGSCALAPVVVIDGVYHNKLKMEDLPGIIEQHAGAEVEEAAS